MSNLLLQVNSLDRVTVPGFLVQSSSESVSIQPVQSVSEKTYSREDLGIFFGIGITVNVVMVVAFIIWGIKQWKKHDTSKK